MNVTHPNAASPLFESIKKALRLTDDVERVTLTINAAGNVKVDVERIPSHADIAAITQAIKGENGTDHDDD